MIPGDNPVQLSHGAVIVLTAVICSIVFFVIGCVVGVLCLQCILKCKKESATEKEQDVPVPVPIYEDIHTISCRRKTIELNGNEAYGQTKLVC